MSTPRKESFQNTWGPSTGALFVMGVGGAFDILAGKTRRAPRWVRRAGLEWLYRLAQEPRRLWKRYLITNFVFVGLVVRQLLKRGALR